MSCRGPKICLTYSKSSQFRAEMPLKHDILFQVALLQNPDFHRPNKAYFLKSRIFGVKKTRFFYIYKEKKTSAWLSMLFFLILFQGKVFTWSLES